MTTPFNQMTTTDQEQTLINQLVTWYKTNQNQLNDPITFLQNLETYANHHPHQSINQTLNNLLNRAKNIAYSSSTS